MKAITRLALAAAAALLLVLSFAAAPATADWEYSPDLVWQYSPDYDWAYSVGYETGANYGVKGKLTGPGGAIDCEGSGTGFVYLGLWQGANGGDPDSWVEVGYVACRLYIYGWWSDPTWIYAEKKDGVYSEWIVGLAAYATTNSYKVFSHMDGRYRIFINGDKVGTVTGFEQSGYPANRGEAGLEVVNRTDSTMTNVPWKRLRYWPNRTNYYSWDGEDECWIFEPAGGRWTLPDKWRTDLNQTYTNSDCYP